MPRYLFLQFHMV